MTTTATEPDRSEAGSGPVRWASDRDYSAEWTESRFVQHWTEQPFHQGLDRTPPMCSLCGIFIHPPGPNESEPDRTETEPDRRSSNREDENRFGGIADDRDDSDGEESDNDEDNDNDYDEENDNDYDEENENDYDEDEDEDDYNHDDDEEDESSENDESDDDGSGGPTAAELLRFFMDHHHPDGILIQDGDIADTDSDDEEAFERHRALVERHIRETHGAPDDYGLDQKDFVPPQPNPCIYVSTAMLRTMAPAPYRSPDDVFEEVSDKFLDVKVGAVPSRTMYGWVRVLALGLGRETRGLKGSLGELLHMCYEHIWRKANTVL